MCVCVCDLFVPVEPKWSGCFWCLGPGWWSWRCWAPSATAGNPWCSGPGGVPSSENSSDANLEERTANHTGLSRNWTEKWQSVHVLILGLHWYEIGTITISEHITLSQYAVLPNYHYGYYNQLQWPLRKLRQVFLRMQNPPQKTLS